MIERSHDPERALALSYAPADRRGGLTALFALDATLGQVLRTTREPLVGQMRLTWWYEALEALDGAPPPAQPVLQALAAEVLPRGVSGAQLAKMIDGWEALLEEPLDGQALSRHAILRGARLFEAAAVVLGGGSGAGWRVERLGRGWAYADLAKGISDRAVCSIARDRAAVRLALFRPGSMERRLRSLGAFALTARMNLEAKLASGAPRRVTRLAWHRITGR